LLQKEAGSIAPGNKKYPRRQGNTYSAAQQVQVCVIELPTYCRPRGTSTSQNDVHGGLAQPHGVWLPLKIAGFMI
jgi:hypothetical protein